jgi:polysaccharide biosynthesis transport protein
VIATGVAAGGFALAFSLAQTEQYTSEATLLFREAGFDQQLFGASGAFPIDPDREAATNVGLISLNAVAELTANDLDDPDVDADDVEGIVSIESDGASDLVTIEATSSDPEMAADVANSFAKNYVEFRRNADREQVANARELVEADLESLDEVEVSTEEGQALARQVSQLKALEALQTGNAEVVQNATEPTEPSSPKTVRNTVLGGLLGLLLGTALAVFLERFDRRLRSPKELEAGLGTSLLVAVPDDRKVARSDNGMRELQQRHPVTFHTLRTRLKYFNVDGEIRSVLITSPHSGDGKSTMSWSLAANAAAAGQEVLLVETDMHKPTLALQTRHQPIPGLSECLSGQSSLDEVTRRVQVNSVTGGEKDEPTLSVIFSGSLPPNPAELLESQRMSALLEQFSTQYDLVVIDTPPLLKVADAVPLIQQVDGVVVVGHVGRTTADEAEELATQLKTYGASLLGVIANRAKASRGSSDAYGYGYGYEPKKSKRKFFQRLRG